MQKKFSNSFSIIANKLDYHLNGILNQCINIGCGADEKKFWLNCDINPANNNIFRLDITSETDLNWLEDQSATIITCDHVIGYLTIAQADRFFYACHRSLVSGGRLILEFPDLHKIANQIISLDYNSDENERDYIEAIRAIYAYDYEEAFSRNFESKTYVTGWTCPFLISRLEKIGFSLIKIENPLTHQKRCDRDSRIVAIKI